MFSQEQRKLGNFNSSIVKRLDALNKIEKGEWNGKDLRTLRKYLEIKNGRKCDICGIFKWMDKEIVLEVHYIDGNRKNNLLSNLNILCPNCHSQTSNFKNKKR